MHKSRDLIYDALLLISDMLAIIGAYILAYTVRSRLIEKPLAFPYGFMPYIKTIIIFIPVWIIIFALVGLYRSFARPRLETYGQILIAVAGGSMLLILVDFYRRTPLFPSKAISIYGFLFSLILVIIGREVLFFLKQILAKRGIGAKRVALVGVEDKTTERIVNSLQKEGAKIVAVVANKPWAIKTKYSTSIQSFRKQLNKLRLDEVVYISSETSQAEYLELIRACHEKRISFRMVPNVIGLTTVHQRLNSIAGVPIIDIKPTPLDGWGRIIKRLFDFCGALFGIIVLSPLFLFIAILIKLMDPGPVYFKQKRLTRDTKPIYIYKFRTMCQEFSGKSDKKAFQLLGRPELYKEFVKHKKLSNDPRLSRIGKLLRKTSIDELPQLINVLKGELSLVGPRPMIEDELERFGRSLSSVLILKCGMTGLWQVSGRSDIGFEGRVRLDLYYVENWSLWLDIRIIVRTIKMILLQRGAY